MMNINEITMGMTPQEKEIYFAHMEKRNREEAERIELEKAELMRYKNSLIDGILSINPRWTYEELKSKSIRTLERIFS